MPVNKIEFNCEGKMKVLDVFDMGFVDPNSNRCLIKDKNDAKYPCNNQILESEK